MMCFCLQKSIAFCFFNKMSTVTKKQKMTSRGFLYWGGFISLITDSRIETFYIKFYIINLVVQKKQFELPHLNKINKMTTADFFFLI